MDERDGASSSRTHSDPELESENVTNDDNFQEYYCGAENRCFPNTDPASNTYYSYDSREIKPEVTDDFLGNSSFMEGYCTEDDCAPSLSALKLENESKDFNSSFSERDHYSNFDPENTEDQYTFEESDRNFMPHLSNNLYNNNSSHYQSNIYSQSGSSINSSQNYYSAPGTSRDMRYQDHQDTPHGFSFMEEHSPWMAEEEEEPLDLSIPKDEDSTYGSSFDEFSCSPRDYSMKSEGNEENAWLKKIKTGTRSRVRSPKSWEFLLRLLMDPRSNPSMIKWEDEGWGTFRLVQKDEIAKIWGMRSNKHKDGGLSYDNFARNLRYHYKTKMLVPVSEKHLVYRFSDEVMERRFDLNR